LIDQNSIRRQSRFYLLYEVLNENKEIIIGPAFTLVPQLFSLPLFIASVLLVCQTLETNPIRYLLIMSYFTSFIPQLISFFLYISPSCASSSCLLWPWFHYFLNTINLFGLAFGNIERYWLFFIHQL
jgi:hypothetical protein